MSAEFLPWAQGLATRVGWTTHNARSPHSLTVVAPPNYPLNVTTSGQLPWGTPVVTFSVPLATIENPDASALLWIACANQDAEFGSYAAQMHDGEIVLFARVSFLADTVTERSFAIALTTLHVLEAHWRKANP